MEEKLIAAEHGFVMEQRKSCRMTGVCDVVAFDEHIVLLKTAMGELEIRGDNLHMKHLTLENGTVEVEGMINSFEYQDSGFQKQGESFWKRLLR